MIRTKLRSALAAFRRLARGAEGRGFGGSAPSVDIAAPLTTQIISLWPEGAPGAEARRNEAERARDWWVKNVHSPSLTAFFPAREAANGAAVIIAPGGGHRELVFEAEGIEPARFLARLGVTAFALKYRLAREPGSTYDIERDAGADMRRAVRLVRSRAAEWAIDAARVGAMGWSAGGELAAMVAFRPVLGDPRASDPIERASARPDFLILVYPGDSLAEVPSRGRPGRSAPFRRGAACVQHGRAVLLARRPGLAVTARRLARRPPSPRTPLIVRRIGLQRRATPCNRVPRPD